jgi:hypothetical protein
MRVTCPANLILLELPDNIRLDMFDVGRNGTGRWPARSWPTSARAQLFQSALRRGLAGTRMLPSNAFQFRVVVFCFHTFVDDKNGGIPPVCPSTFLTFHTLNAHRKSRQNLHFRVDLTGLRQESVVALVNTVTNLQFYTKRGIYWLHKRLSASQEGFCSVSRSTPRRSFSKAIR